jgi:hypothetical protein
LALLIAELLENVMAVSISQRLMKLADLQPSGMSPSMLVLRPLLAAAVMICYSQLLILRSPVRCWLNEV